ncbi:MAG: CDP-alcohol phosphatidyltransferase family protein [Rhizobiaceae bacterium]|nr:CDP-alcohol phosphatidyltransferase family protein [Rhizobiaceae bacterium]
MTVPNVITILRLLLVPAIVYWLLTDDWKLAFAAFVLAGVSDGVDGFIARRFNQRSRLGSYLDPMADKLMLVSVFVVLGVLQELPLWLVIAAVSRDGLIVVAILLSSLLGRPVEMKPLFVSKANTAAQIALVVVVLAELAFTISLPYLRPGLIMMSGLLTVASAAAYLVSWLRHMGTDGESGPYVGQ